MNSSGSPGKIRKCPWMTRAKAKMSTNLHKVVWKFCLSEKCLETLTFGVWTERNPRLYKSKFPVLKSVTSHISRKKLLVTISLLNFVADYNYISLSHYLNERRNQDLRAIKKGQSQLLVPNIVYISHAQGRLNVGRFLW